MAEKPRTTPTDFEGEVLGWAARKLSDNEIGAPKFVEGDGVGVLPSYELHIPTIDSNVANAHYFPVMPNGDKTILKIWNDGRYLWPHYFYNSRKSYFSYLHLHVQWVWRDSPMHPVRELPILKAVMRLDSPEIDDAVVAEYDDKLRDHFDLLGNPGIEWTGHIMVYNRNHYDSVP